MEQFISKDTVRIVAFIIKLFNFQNFVVGIDMLDEIARRLNFNYSIRIATDAAYGKEDENGQWSGIIGELTRRVRDMFYLIVL